MYCQYCERDIEDGASVCRYCGKAQAPAEAAPVAAGAGTILLRIHAIMALVLAVLPFFPFYTIKKDHVHVDGNSLIDLFKSGSYGAARGFLLSSAIMLLVTGGILLLTKRSTSVVFTFSAAVFFLGYYCNIVTTELISRSNVDPSFFSVLALLIAIGVIVTALLYLTKYRGRESAQRRDNHVLS